MSNAHQRGWGHLGDLFYRNRLLARLQFSPQDAVPPLRRAPGAIAAPDADRPPRIGSAKKTTPVVSRMAAHRLRATPAPLCSAIHRVLPVDYLAAASTPGAGRLQIRRALRPSSTMRRAHRKRSTTLLDGGRAERLAELDVDGRMNELLRNRNRFMRLQVDTPADQRIQCDCRHGDVASAFSGGRKNWWSPRSSKSGRRGCRVRAGYCEMRASAGGPIHEARCFLTCLD